MTEAAVAPTIRVVLGEDNLIAREGIVRILRRIEGVEVVAECIDLPELREAIERERPAVVLTDIRLPPSGTDEGIQLARELRASHPEMGVVVLSQHIEPMYAAALLREGAQRRAYLVKDRVRDVGELRRALYEVAAGGSVVDPLVVEEMLNHWVVRMDSPVARLTPRERELLALIAQGQSNAGIAEALGITRRGVERHINAIFTKLGLVDREQVSPRVKATLLFLADQGEVHG